MSVDFFRHSLTPASAQAVAEVLGTPFLTSGPVGRKVEAMLTEFFGTSHALLVNSWTNGALAALVAVDLKPGDEVIVPAMTFIAAANVVEVLGARPVFVDVDPESLLLTPEAVAAALTPRTRAVIPTHLYGQMCDMVGIRKVLAGRPDVLVIEDCAHCFEGSRDGYRPGQHGDLAIFSFYATKNVTCGEGGAVVTNHAELAERIQRTRLHGMSKAAVDRFHGGRYSHWDMAVLGVKANLPDLLAALLPPQITTVYERLAQRQAVADGYRRALAGTSIRLVRQHAGVVNAEHLMPIHVPPAIRDSCIEALNGRGIGVTVNYRSIPTMTYYREKYSYAPEAFPVSYEWGEGTLSLPLYPSLSLPEQQEVISAVLEELVPRVRAHDDHNKARIVS